MTIDELKARAQNEIPSSNVSLVTVSPSIAVLHEGNLMEVDMLDLESGEARNQDTRRWFKATDLFPAT